MARCHWLPPPAVILFALKLFMSGLTAGAGKGE